MTGGLKRYILPGSILLLLFAAAVNLAFSFSPPTLAHAQTTPPCLSLTSNLSTGSTGHSVTALQDFLRSNGFLSVASTGYYGPMTAAAVGSFQTFYGLPAIGAVGPLTRVAIQAATCQPIVTPAPTPIVVASSTPATATTTSTTASSTTPTKGTLPYHAETFTDWQTAWGSVSTTSTGELHLQGTLTNNGAEAIYPASLKWTDYRYTVNASVAFGNISLIARYIDGNNFLSCGFSRDWVEIDQVANGTSTVLASKSVPGILTGYSPAKTTAVSMSVKGNTVSCAGFGPSDNITYTLPAGSPMQGGIGIESWFATALADQLDLHSVQVDPI
jgi:peptidoglycan hydrolase-like protein with peptidoglycan-binding domain